MIAIPAIRTVHLSWFSPSDTEPTAIIQNYHLTCIPQVADLGAIKMTYLVPENFTVAGFRPATEYNCSIVASNSAGYSPPAVVNVMTMDECKTSNTKIIIGMKCL